MKYNVEFRFDSGKSFPMQVNLDYPVTKHFSMEETINKSAPSGIKCVFTTEMLVFLQLREEFRNDYYERFKRGMTCTSCWRNPVFNKQVGGTSNSLHLRGMAADLLTGIPLSDKVWEWCIEECKKLQTKYNTVMELGRYNNPDRIHIGMGVTYSMGLYTFDKRAK